jgi:hypothetical protein
MCERNLIYLRLSIDSETDPVRQTLDVDKILTHLEVLWVKVCICPIWNGYNVRTDEFRYLA